MTNIKLNTLNLSCIIFFCFMAVNQLAAQEPTHGVPFQSCLYQPEIQISRSKELSDLALADQKDRFDWRDLSEDQLFLLLENDLTRRKRVGEIFAEGCIKSAEDYAAAALIYQHGDVPDHYYQAYIWGSHAVELGDVSQKGMIALTIDRYLISIGKKQLFGSQAFAASTAGCFCLQPTEPSFPDTRRSEYTGLTLQDRYEWLASLNQGKECSNIECQDSLIASPEGTIPGFW